MPREQQRGQQVQARAASDALVAFEQVSGALVTALLAFCVLVWLVLAVLLTVVGGLGLLLLPSALRATHVVADRERARLRRSNGPILGPGDPPRRLREAAGDADVRRELRWLVGHATGGLLLAGLGLLLPVSGLRDITMPLWWRFFAEGEVLTTLSLWVVRSWAGAFASLLLGVGWIVLAVALTPVMARWLVRRGLRLLPLDPSSDLTLRVARLSATRAAALDAHATELRRIERALHDGTQNRLVAATVLLGAARRAMARDPAMAAEILDRAHAAAEDALAEPRSVVRGILPPVLTDRGLDGALQGLAATSVIPCKVDVHLPGRCPAAVEATAYFVVAEALTNASRHSGASSVEIALHARGADLCVRVMDDGTGGADETGGSGLLGIRRRVEALDGTVTLTSPVGGPTTLEVRLACGS